MDRELLRQYRDKTLVVAYQLGMANIHGVLISALEKELGLTRKEFSTVYELLWNQGMLDNHCPVGSLKLSYPGQLEAESIDQSIAMRPVRRNSTAPAPATINYGTINNVVGSPNSNIQQGRQQLKQTTLSEWSPHELSEVLARIEERVDALGADQEILKEISHQMAALRQQLGPQASQRSNIISAIGKTLWDLISKCTSSVAGVYAAKLYAALPPE